MRPPALEGHRLVFLGGLHRSGTTPLARMLAAHPEVSGFSGTGAKEDEGQHLQSVYPAANTHGRAGRFALAPAAHLDETSPLVGEASVRRLWEEWGRHWQLERPVLLEKSPPNLVMTRFLQALFPEASFVMIVRHPAVVSLSTRKWARGTPLPRLMAHWFHAHDVLRADAPRVARLHVLKYEHLVARPTETLERLRHFLGLGSPIAPVALDPTRSRAYEERWCSLLEDRRSVGGWTVRKLVRRYGEAADEYGYSLVDLHRAGPFPSLHVNSSEQA